jgi:hypothetical protein
MCHLTHFYLGRPIPYPGLRRRPGALAATPQNAASPAGRPREAQCAGPKKASSTWQLSVTDVLKIHLEFWTRTLLPYYVVHILGLQDLQLSLLTHNVMFTTETASAQ